MIPDYAKLGALFLLAALLAATFFVYQPGVHGPFLLDDHVGIKDLRITDTSPEGIVTSVMRSERLAGLSRSLTNLSLAGTRYLSGYLPAPFKKQNLLIHLANALLVFWLATLLSTTAARRSAPNRSDYLFALALAAIWTLHPLHVSTVLYAVQRLVLLSAFFSLFTLCLYIEGRRLLPSRPAIGIALILFSLGIFWPLGLFSKENAALVAPILLLLEWFIFAKHQKTRTEARTVYGILLVFSIAPLLLGIIYFALNHEQLLAGYLGRPFTLWERLLTEPHVLWLYIKLLLIPVPGAMSLYHDGFPIQSALDAPTILAIGALLSLIIIAFALRTRHPLVGFGILWFLLWHSLESTIIPLELVFEHRNYLASLGLFLAMAGLVRALVTSPRHSRIAAVSVSALALLLGLNTASRAQLWSDAELLTTTNYLNHPESPRLTSNMLGLALKRGDAEAARAYLERCKKAAPNNPYPWFVEYALRCSASSVPKGLYEETLSRAKDGLVTPGSINSFRILADRFHKGDCSILDANQVIELAAALADNPRVHTPTTRFAAYGNYAIVLIREGHDDEAKRAMSTALDIAAEHSPSRFVNAVDGARFLASHLDGPDAIEFLSSTLTRHAGLITRHGIEVSFRFTAGDRPEEFRPDPR